MPPSSSADLSALLAEAPWVRGFAASLVRDQDRVDDLVQETWLAALQKRPKADRSLRGWLATVVRNLVRQDARGGRRREGRERDAARAEATPSTLELVERLALHRQLVDALEALDEPYRSTLLLRYLEECSPSAIARRLGVPVATVKTRLARGLERVRRRLDAEHGEDRAAWLIAFLPWIENPGGPSAAALGAFVVSTQIKIGLALAVVCGGIWVAWPSTERAGASGAVAAEEREDDEPRLAEPATLASEERAAAGGTRAPAAAVAQEPAVVEEREPEAAAAALPLRGLVLDCEARPAGRVPLRLTTGGRAEESDAAAVFEGSSRADGTFLFEGVEGGGLVVAGGRELATVYAGAVSSNRRDARPVVVVAPRIELSGRVVDETGRPLEGARVATVLPAGFRARFGEVMDYSSAVPNEARTDADGRFALPETPRVAGAQLGASLVGYVDHGEELPEYSDSGLLLVLRRPAVVEGTLRGQVVDSAGAGVPEAQVSYGLEVTETDEYGSFQFDMNNQESINRMVAERLGGAQPNRLIALKAGYRPGRLDVALDDTGGELVWPDAIVLQLGDAPLTVEGRVVDDIGEPLPGIRVWIADPTIFSMGREGSQVLESKLAGATDAWNWVETDAHGAFSLGGLDARGYTIAAMDMATLARVEHGPVDAGARGVRVVLDGGERWRRVAGRVVDRRGEPVAGVSVAPVTDSFRLRYMGQVVRTSHSGLDAVVTDSDGEFELLDVPKNLVYLRLDGEDILSDDHGRRAEGGLEELHPEGLDDMRIVARMRVHVQVELADPSEADALAVLDEAGERITINVIQGTSRRETPTVQLVEGRSDVLTVHDGATTLVLLKGGVEVRRAPLELQRGEVNTIRP